MEKVEKVKGMDGWIDKIDKFLIKYIASASYLDLLIFLQF